MNYQVTNAPKIPLQIMEIIDGVPNIKTEYVEPVVQAPSVEDAKAYLLNKYMDGEYVGELNNPDEWVVTEIKN